MNVTVAVSVAVAPNSAYTIMFVNKTSLYSRFDLTMISCVSSTDSWGIFPSLSSHGDVVSAQPNGCRGSKTREGLEVQPQLANVILDLVDCVFTRASRGWGV